MSVGQLCGHGAHHYKRLSGGTTWLRSSGERTLELCEFLVDVLQIEQIEGQFPAQGRHPSELSWSAGIADGKLRVNWWGPSYSKMRKLLASLEGIEFSELERPDECCGFGGTFAINEEAISCSMGQDRIQDHLRAGTEVLTAPDMSCLMHLGGLLRRQGNPLPMMHIAQILAGRPPRTDGCFR